MLQNDFWSRNDTVFLHQVEWGILTHKTDPWSLLLPILACQAALSGLADMICRPASSMAAGSDALSSPLMSERAPRSTLVEKIQLILPIMVVTAMASW